MVGMQMWETGDWDLLLSGHADGIAISTKVLQPAPECRDSPGFAPLLCAESPVDSTIVLAQGCPTHEVQGVHVSARRTQAPVLRDT